MKVQVWRSGGLLGRRVEWDVIVDEQPDPDQWYLLINELPWDQCSATNTAPDRYTYEIRCDPHEVVIPEQELTGPWRELVDRVRDANARARTNQQSGTTKRTDTPAEPQNTTTDDQPGAR